jgi:pimeloyl-ACP methyl ester carboxylesterase
MTNKPVELQTGYVRTEGDELYYEVRGHGGSLLMIPGGGGDARLYSFVADILSDEYKVITYDRRANSRSTKNAPQNFEISQQSRDAMAVLNAAGETSTFIFGNSSGAVIALDMAKTQPQAVRALIVHEPPLARLHPQAKKWQRFFASVYWTAFGLGAPLAMPRFVLGVGLPMRPMISNSRNSEIYKKKRDKMHVRPENVSDFFVKQELLAVTNYKPDVETIQKNGVKVFMAAGKTSLDKKRFYAQTAPILADMLCCEMVVFPGHHVSYLDMPEEWAAVLRAVLHKAEGQVN